MSEADADSWGFEPGEEVVPGAHALRKLGGGHRYEAYLAFDDGLYTTVVVKVVRPGRVTERSTLEGLEAEARALERLDHPVVLRKFGQQLEGERPHLILEHLEGPRLSSLLRKHGPLSPDQLVPLGVQLCAAIHYMHGAGGMVHLDIKPSNIIMGAPPRMIDLSIACTLSEARQITRSMGTDAYMAPEQCLPRELGPPGPPADVWGLAASLYRAQAGGRPFSQGEPDAEEPERRWPQLVEPPLPLGEGLPPFAIEAIEAGLARAPEDRPAPAELAAALERVMGTLPRPSIGRLKPRLAGRRR